MSNNQLNAMDRYQEAAARTAPEVTKENKALVISNMAMGLAGEAGEVVDYLKKVYHHGHELDKEELTKELGDFMWYAALVARMHGIKLSTVAAKNIDKLKKRYPAGFDEEKSKNRTN